MMNISVRISDLNKQLNISKSMIDTILSVSCFCMCLYFCGQSETSRR